MQYKLIVRLLLSSAGLVGATAAVAQTGPLPDTSAPAVPSPATAASTADASEDTQDIDTQDIIVTAQRRSEALSRTPVSVAVVSADTLAKAQIVTENDLRFATPGLQIRGGSNSNQINYAIRGESLDPFSNTRPGVLPYLNEVQIGGQGGASAFYDLASVQVLKGPQGTLFGRSATGGAVLFATAKPTDQFGGYISGLYGTYNAAKVEGAISGPIAGDRLMARLAGFYRSRDGFQRNLYDGTRVGDQKQYGGRFSLSAKLGESIKNDLVVDYLHSNSENTVAVLSGLVPFTGTGAPFVPIQFLYSGTSTPVASVTGQCTLQAFAGFPGPCPPVNPMVAGYYNAYFADPHHPANGISGQLAEQQARGPYVINSNAANDFRTNNVIVTNTTSYDVGGETSIKNIFGYASIRSFVRQDTDGTPYQASAGVGLRSITAQVSDEAQLIGKLFGDRLDYVTGLYFSSERARTQQESAFFDLVFGGVDSIYDYRINNRTLAVYGQGTYKLNDAGLAATLGGRFTSERVAIHVLPDDSVRLALGPTPPPGFAYDQHRTYDRFSWTVGLQDQISPETLLYFTSRRAYKSGGYNGQVQPKIGGADVAGDRYLAERVTDVEGGAKFNGRLGDMPARLDIALYYSWIADSQRAAFTVVNGGPATLTVNVPNGRTYGVEADAQIKPTRWLALGGTANYTKATFGSEPFFANGQSQSFDQVPDTPKFSGSLFADINVPVSDALSALLHGDVYRQSSSFTTSRSANRPGSTIPAYTLANFRVGVENESAGWSLTANLKNAFNHVYYVGGVGTGDIYQINLLIPGERRTFTVEARFKF